ncbi:hypothetical protein CJF15_18295 [Clostridium botulinum]|uniref:hypothetical protein n=1 Tax=Clostridium botulinum TaxID=1491 RepID=UPI0013F0C55D|nr:hypothetical protein [Clostridium botulinum]MBN3411006.1 hypothetical protein [Clostridium botulinum]MBY6875095.1 hypothetical protein [Clostridium botulinum]NEZ80468.1 hypothetical protein [Clostridium botulinum]NFA17825.1 hypothetical protein [Clostridium botulinum]NFA54421.1 hypothetical protein [Clostridium botulinum]
MILTENESYLLATGFTKTKKDIRLKLKKGSIYNKQFNRRYEDVYIIEDIEEAIKLYKRYKKTFRRIFKCWNDEFINNMFIMQFLE